MSFQRALCSLQRTALLASGSGGYLAECWVKPCPALSGELPRYPIYPARRLLLCARAHTRAPEPFLPLPQDSPLALKRIVFLIHPAFFSLFAFISYDQHECIVRTSIKMCHYIIGNFLRHILEFNPAIKVTANAVGDENQCTVSYTHLTLPTIYSV